MIYLLYNKDTQKYATEKEMLYLRVNAGGVVEELIAFGDIPYKTKKQFEADRKKPMLKFWCIDMETNFQYLWQLAPEWEIQWQREFIGTELKKAYEKMMNNAKAGD